MAKKAEKPKVDISVLVAEYRELTKKESMIKKRKTELSALIKDYAQENGVKNDSGSFYCENENYTYGSMAKKSVTLDKVKAEVFFKAKNLWDRVIKTVVTIDEDAVEKLVSEGEVTNEELESICEIKVSYAVDVKEKKREETVEEMPEIQVVSNSVKKLPKLVKK